MNYIENIFICIAAPLVVAIICLPGNRRKMLLFFTGGMTVCLMSSYISSFIAADLGADILSATFEITPVVEELMKLFPVMFYLLVFEPKREEAASAVMMIAVGFATFENVCYLTSNGADDVFHLLVRGFGAGTMHVVCGFIVAIGLLYLWDMMWLRVAGTLGLVSITITYHAIYNLLISQSGMIMMFGFIIFVLMSIFVLFLGKNILRQITLD